MIFNKCCANVNCLVLEYSNFKISMSLSWVYYQVPWKLCHLILIAKSLCFVVKIRVTCQCTSSIESKTITWISRTGCSFRTIAGSGPALGALCGVVALEDIQHLDIMWEKVIVRFRKVNTDYQIYSIYLSTHSQKITKKYVGEFLWQGGKFKKGSRTLDMYSGTHAIVYSAKGSHGIWPNSGKHKYKKVPITGQWLQDECSSGTSWHTWNKLKPVQYDPNGRYRGEFKFLGFQGHWGNRKRGCGRWDIIEKILGTCMLGDGPGGPSRFPDFG